MTLEAPQSTSPCRPLEQPPTSCHHQRQASHYRAPVPSHRRASSVTPQILRRRVAAVGGAVVVVGGVIAGVLLAGHHSPKPVASSSTSAPTTVSHATRSGRCPLTDLPAPGGKVPQRVPLAVKIGNEPGPEAGGLGAARPQSGLNEADIVYDTPAEGGIMRYVAVYQCHNASSIGPVRSLRWVDWHILAEFRMSILAHVGGIVPDVTALDKLPYVADANAFTYPNAYHRISNRVAPDNDYTSTQALWALFKGPKFDQAPAPVFQYTPALPSGAKPVRQVGINFSAGTDAVWRWDPTTKQFLHFYGSTPDVDTLTNQQVSTTNIFIQIVRYSFGPYPESPGSTGDVESVTTGSGPGFVLRDGEMIPVTWHRPTLSDGTTFTNAKGQEVGLAPGRTWVEMVLNSTAKVPGAITFTS